MLVVGGRLAQKALHDVLKLSGGAPAQSWGPEQWFVSTAGGTLRVCGVEEVDGERSCLQLPGHKSPEAGVPWGAVVQRSCPQRPLWTPASTVSAGSTSWQRLLLCAGHFFLLPQAGQDLPVFLPWFSSPAGSMGGCGSCIAPSGPYLPWTLGTLSPCRPFSCTFLFLRGGDPVWLRAVSC